MGEGRTPGDIGIGDVTDGESDVIEASSADFVRERAVLRLRNAIVCMVLVL